MAIRQCVSLRTFNTFGFEANAEQFVSVTHLQQLRQLLQSYRNQPILVLGGGSNIVLSPNIAGIVIKMDEKGIAVEECSDQVLVTAKAGENWHQLVTWTIQRGIYGLENLALIPGSVGAAPIQNIGAYGVELADVFYQLQAIDRMTGDIRTFNKADCQFAYRHSIFKGEHQDRYIIVAVTLQLSRLPQCHIDYAELKEALARYQENVTPERVSKVVCEIRRRKLPDPSVLGNAGSFFKNPVIAKSKAGLLKQTYTDAVIYPVSNTQSKVSAGWLIQQCGYKGIVRDHIGVYQHQALILFNDGLGTSKALLALAREIQQAVQQRFDIALEIEPRVY